MIYIRPKQRIDISIVKNQLPNQSNNFAYKFVNNYMVHLLRNY